MKYQVEYTRGNGYTCSCCGCFSEESFICNSYEDALQNVASIMNYKRGDGYYDTVIPIPEHPDDFIKEEDVLNEKNPFFYKPKFNLEEFNKQAEQLANTLKIQMEKERANEKAKKEAEIAKNKEEFEKLEYLRLKAKFEKI